MVGGIKEFLGYRTGLVLSEIQKSKTTLIAVIFRFLVFTGSEDGNRGCRP
jgi:hypothetical protein